MIQRLERRKREVYYYSDDVRVDGLCPKLTGDCSELRGDCTGLRGDCSGLVGDCTELWGNCSGLRGDCTDLRGDCTELWGNCSSLSGNCTRLRGNCSGLIGDCSNLSGNCTNLRGDCTELVGDCTDCDLTNDERLAGVEIASLVLDVVASPFSATEPELSTLNVSVLDTLDRMQMQNEARKLLIEEKLKQKFAKLADRIDDQQKQIDNNKEQTFLDLAAVNRHIERLQDRIDELQAGNG